MSDFLTRRGGIWHFVRRVPLEYAALDPREIVRHSTRVKIADDRTGRRAARVALTLNEELEAYWSGLARGQSVGGLARYDEARHRARSLGFDYVPNDQHSIFFVGNDRSKVGAWFELAKESVRSRSAFILLETTFQETRFPFR